MDINQKLFNLVGNISQDGINLASLCDVKQLIKDGADVNAKNKDGETALIVAVNAFAGNDVIQCLIDAGVDVNSTDVRGKTALMNAALFANVDVVKLLIDAGADVHAKDKSGGTALLHATSIPTEDAGDVIKLVVDAGASINAVNNNDVTALMMAVACSNYAQTKSLLDLGADTSIKNKDGKTVFDLSKEYYKANIAKLLADKLHWQSYGHLIASTPILVESDGNFAF